VKPLKRRPSKSLIRAPPHDINDNSSISTPSPASPDNKSQTDRPHSRSKVVCATCNRHGALHTLHQQTH
jgi:hypothetical protein